MAAIALANGARAVVPLESSDEVITRSKGFDRSEVRLAGERRTAIGPFEVADVDRAAKALARVIEEARR